MAQVTVYVPDDLWNAYRDVREKLGSPDLLGVRNPSQLLQSGLRSEIGRMQEHLQQQKESES